MTTNDRVRLAGKLGLVLVLEPGRKPEYRHDDQQKQVKLQYQRVFYPPEQPRLAPKEDKWRP